MQDGDDPNDRPDETDHDERYGGQPPYVVLPPLVCTRGASSEACLKAERDAERERITAIQGAACVSEATTRLTLRRIFARSLRVG